MTDALPCVSLRMFALLGGFNFVSKVVGPALSEF